MRDYSPPYILRLYPGECGSGYLGGTLLARLSSAQLPAYEKIYALVRTDEQATAIRQYNVEPLRLSSTDEAEVHSTIVSLGITIIFYLINAARSEGQVTMIKALGEVRRRRAAEVDAVHFLHTTGAKVFSSHAGAPTDRPLLDTDANLYAVQKSQRAPFPLMQGAVDTNNTVIEQGELHGVRAYIFAPCIVYGRNEGFGNPISIQTVAIVEAAKAVRRVYRVDEGRPSWPVCHVVDNATLYLALLRRILDDARQGGDEKDSQVLGYGKDGYYLASSGSVAWNDLYAAMGKRLAEKNVIDDAEVVAADDDALDKMAAALACPKDFVPVQLGGRCTFTPRHGEAIGWKPLYPPEHILETADAEVDLILQNLK